MNSVTFAMHFPAMSDRTGDDISVEYGDDLLLASALRLIFRSTFYYRRLLLLSAFPVAPSLFGGRRVKSYAAAARGRVVCAVSAARNDAILTISRDV